MNQIFSIKRFLRYTRFTVSMNRWYYGVLLVLFTIPATVLSLCGVADWLVAGLVGAATFCLSIVPTYDLTALTGWERQLTVPSSWLEKLIVEIVARYWVLIVPFCIHAFGCALGLMESVLCLPMVFLSKHLPLCCCGHRYIFGFICFTKGDKEIRLQGI